MTESIINKPIFIKDLHLKFLDNLRNCGKTNMYGAAPYVEHKFGGTIKQAREIVSYWMKTYSERHKDKPWQRQK